ncbi:MAG: peptidoglycan editing factor PgeF [Proteobacteria bacterium]|nr:peptidoglycan editing factor PgeF [Pseudomonadota bacterium]
MIIQPNWPLPKNIFAASTTRRGGFSTGIYESLNLGDHVDDDPKIVQANREKLKTFLKLPSDPLWMNQVHGNRVISASNYLPNISADACVSHSAREVCIVMTADCLPILLCHRNGSKIAAIHGGWKSLVQNIVENTIAAMNTDPHELMVWLGPAIGPEVYEVGDEVREQFLAKDKKHEAAFKPSVNQRWLANLYLLATQQLQTLGITEIYGGNYCTYSMKETFFSHRRDGKTGRMATLIFMN